MDGSKAHIIKPIQSLRGIFAMLIFLHHFTINKVPLNDTGNMCVVFFIVLTGVVLMLGYGRSDEHRLRYRDFMRRRMLRIYPVYFVTLLLATVVVTVNRWAGLSPKFWADVFMVQTWIPVKSWFFSGNNPSWFVADYLYFYLLFPLLLALTRKHFRICLLGMCIVLAIYFIVLPHLPAAYSEGIVYVAPYTRVIDFSIGILIGYVIVSQTEKDFRDRDVIKASVLEIVVVGFLAVTYLTRTAVPEIYQWASWWWVPVGLLVYCFVEMPFGPGLISRLLSMKLLVKSGDLSYSFFLSGFFCIDASRKIVSKTIGFWENYPWLTLVLSLTLCFISSLIIYRFVELPMIRRGSLAQRNRP